MRPQDIVILLKIICYGSNSWYSKTLANDLNLSTAEISLSLNRNVNAGLLDNDKKKVRKQALFDFIVHGLQYVFPQRPGAMARGLPTAISHPFMKKHFITDQEYVWPDAEGDDKGFSIQPLYTGATSAAKKDNKLYLMLALIDVLRSGKSRERKLALTELEKLINQ
jgi:hypothetical protein